MLTSGVRLGPYEISRDGEMTDGMLMTVSLRQAGPSLALAGRPQRLFETRTPPQVITIVDNLR